jgi:hypothetical protein
MLAEIIRHWITPFFVMGLLAWIFTASLMLYVFYHFHPTISNCSRLPFLDNNQAIRLSASLSHEKTEEMALLIVSGLSRPLTVEKVLARGAMFGFSRENCLAALRVYGFPPQRRTGGSDENGRDGWLESWDPSARLLFSEFLRGFKVIHVIDGFLDVFSLVARM